jgi:hypothetical protein
MVRALATRFCTSLTTRSYDLIEPDALEKAAGRDVDPLGIALEELGRRPECQRRLNFDPVAAVEC